MSNKRNDIMAAVVAVMGNISVTNGYQSELGSNVYEWRPKIITETGGAYVPTAEGELPALHVRDPLDDVTAINMKGMESHDLTVEAEIAHEGGATGATMRKQIADVLKAIGADPKWGGLAIGTSQIYRSETIRAQADRTYFLTLLKFKINYSTSKWSES